MQQMCRSPGQAPVDLINQLSTPSEAIMFTRAQQSGYV